MDTIIKTSLGLFIVILVAFTAIITYSGYTDTAYRNTISGTYSYTFTITTDSSLSNVTFFIPVPVDKAGNSPMVSALSSHRMNGVPADWDTTLFDTGKSTLLKVTTPAIIPPAGTSAQHPYTVTISSETKSKIPIDTQNPVEKSAMFRPVQALKEDTCPPATAGAGSRCYTYTTSLFADYTTSADATVTVTSSVDGKNTWDVFGPHSNEYHTGITLTLRGPNHGWVVPAGKLSYGTGSYEYPFGT